MTEFTVISIRMKHNTHQQLRKIAYLTEQPIAELVRQGIEIVLNRNKKVLNVDDTVV